MAKRLENQESAHFIKPRLRLFLSVDLIGSTTYKVSHKDDPPEGDSWWPLISMQFYTYFQRKFFDNWRGFTILEKTKGGTGDRPKLWKALGDELIFSKICSSPEQVVAMVQVWRRTLIDFKACRKVGELKFKTGGWLVGSPIRNWEVAFLRDEPNELDRTLSGQPIAYNVNLLSQYYDAQNLRKIDIDFIGPSMDYGFRLLELADERRFIMSADLAFLISSRVGLWNEKPYAANYPPIEFFYRGEEHFKGFRRPDAGYPVFWLDAFAVPGGRSEGEVNSELSVLSRNVEPGVVSSALGSFLEKAEGPPDVPYICTVSKNGTITKVLREIPAKHVNEINRLRKLFMAAVYVETSINESLESADGAGDVPAASVVDADLQSLLAQRVDARGRRG